ncbi:MAG: phage portal protein [Methanobrevibacter sp.]|nr:phage portal protein [Methanobrevibacter sp.]
MGLFNRRKATVETVPIEEQRSTVSSVTIDSDTLNGYSLPTALGFESSLKKNVNMLNLSAAFAAIDLISNKIASIPIIVKTIDGEVVEHPLNHVFDNTIVGKFITIKQLVWDTLVNGNGLCYIKRDKNGDAKELIYVPHGSFTICYNQQAQQLYYLIPTISNNKIEPINVIHILKNSIDGVNGKPISWYARKALLLANSAENAALNFFDSGCAISGILKSNKPLSTQQKIDIKSSWQQAHLPNETAGLAVLGNDLDYVTTGSSAGESQLLESRKYSVREIARFLGIPPELIGDEVNKSYNSLQQAVDALITFTLSPFISIFEDEFNRKCLRPSERNLYHIDFKEEDLRMPDETAQAQALNSLVAGGIMTPNEARKILGLPPIEDGDELRQATKEENTDKNINENI